MGTCEDVRKYTDVKRVTQESEIDRFSKKKQFKRWYIYIESLAAVLKEKKEVTLNKPRFIGSAILAISKTLMYYFHYNYMVKNFEGCKVLFTDTDSFCYSLPGEEYVYAKMRGNEC